MKLFIDLDETIVKSVSIYDMTRYHIQNNASFIVTDEGVPGFHVFIRPDFDELKSFKFSIFTASDKLYAESVISNLCRMKPWLRNNITAVYSRDDLSVRPGENIVYQNKCSLIDERHSYDQVVRQKLNALPHGRHIRIKAFDRIDHKIVITDKPGMSLKECIILAVSA